jgi:MFS transporter, PPP family, 3-phenylpropionic acid transporter
MAVITLLFGALIGYKERHTPSNECDASHEECRFSIRSHIPLWVGFFLMQVSFGPFYNFFTIYTTDHGISLDTTDMAMELWGHCRNHYVLFSGALFHTAAISVLFSLYKARRLAQQFFFGISYGLGGFVGALGAGFVYQYAPSTLFIAGGVAAALATAAFVKYSR